MIPKEDLQVETWHNRESGAVRFTHIPTGISRQGSTVGPLSVHQTRKRFLQEIEQELLERGLTQYLAPPFRYEESLSDIPTWALSEGGKFFVESGNVQHALNRVCKRLEEFGIPHAVAGAMALFRHGYRRFTEDVDILVTRDGLKQIHEQLEGRGYLPVFAGSKALRDAEFGVKIEFIVAGEFPGDGKPKPVAFPDPAAVAVELEGIRYVNLTTLIELKLASGMTAPHRLKDLADVQEVIKALRLPREFAENLNPYVRDKFNELWTSPESEQPA